MEEIFVGLTIGVNIIDRNTGVLVVGENVEGKISIINSFEGQEAVEMYEKIANLLLPKTPSDNETQLLLEEKYG